VVVWVLEEELEGGTSVVPPPVTLPPWLVEPSVVEALVLRGDEGGGVVLEGV
jgi:hypothetical protein